MRKIGSYLQSYFNRNTKSIRLTAITDSPMMCFKKPVGYSHTIWHTNVAKQPEYGLKPENIDTSRPEKKALSFPTKFMGVGMQLHLCRLLFLT